MRRFVEWLVAFVLSLFAPKPEPPLLTNRNELHLGYNADNEGEFISLPLNGLTHTHFKGMTGQGKSSLLAHAAASLIHAGVGVCLLDPAGDLSEQIVSLLINTGYYDDHPDAIERVVYLPLERGHSEKRYIPFNILTGYYDAYAAASVALEGFRRFFTDLEEGKTININSVIHLGSYALAEHGLPLLPFWVELFSDPKFYQYIVPNLKDQHIRRQFEVMKLESIFYKEKETGEVKTKTPEIADTAIKRMNRLIISPHVRYPLAQKDNLLDPAKLIQSGRSVLLNLGISDPHAKSLIGALFTQAFEQTSRTYRPIGKMHKYVLIIDELEEFAFQSGKALESMFAEARKAEVAVWVAHQYGGQLSDDLNAALTQCATKVTFKTGYDDAVVSVRNMGFTYNPYWVKETTGNLVSPGSQRTVYFTEAEQTRLYADNIMTLDVQEAFIQRPEHELSGLVTFDLKYKPDEYRIEQLTRLYLDRYFRSVDDIERDNTATIVSSSPPPTPSDTVEPTPPPQRPHKVTLRDLPPSPPAPQPLNTPPPSEQPKQEVEEKPKRKGTYNLDDLDLPEVDNDY